MPGLTGTGPIGPSTPQFLQRWTLGLPLLIGALAVFSVTVGFIVQADARSSTRSSAPALIGLQNMFASVAEANAAATSVQLSTSLTGQEDRVNRNLYLEALGRAGDQVTTVAADLGTDHPAQAPLQRVSRSLTTYSGEIEAARASNAVDQASADQGLGVALTIAEQQIGPAVVDTAELARQRFDSETGNDRRAAIGLVLAVAAITLTVMIVFQVRMAQRTRRIFNPFLVLSTLAVVGVVVVVGRAELVRSAAIDSASVGGYNAIVRTAELQSGIFANQSDLALTILDEGASAADYDRLEQQAMNIDVLVLDISSAADSRRERAAADTLGIRWDRHRANLTDAVDAARAGRRDQAVLLLQGEGLSSFNGVNTAVESVLSDNRSQFLSGVETAGSAVELTPWLCLLLSMAAGLLTVVGIQRRLAEYR